MSLGAILGLVGLNLFFLLVGVAVLFAIRGWQYWSELARLGGLAYMLGVALLGVLWTWELTAGLDLSLFEIVVSGAGVIALGILVGLRLGRTLPPRPRIISLFSPASVAAAIFCALTSVYLEALFRAGRLAGLYEFDGWAFWVPKGKAIFLLGGIDSQFFHQLPGPSYPPLVPALEAAAFRFIGEADVVTLHLQFWFLLLGFVAAVAGVLSTRASARFVWPPLLLLLVTPHVIRYALQAQGDVLLDELIALAGLLLALWLVEGDQWPLFGATLLLASAALTKREGYLFAAVVLAAAVVASWSDARARWPSLVAVGVVAVALTAPWRLYLLTNDLPRGGPEAGGLGLFAHAERALPSLRLALSVFFDYGIWLVVMPVFLVALLAASIGGNRLLAGYAGAMIVFSVASLTWTTWAFPSLPITKNAALNPIIRASGSAVFLVTALVPLLLASAWRGASKSKDEVNVRIGWVAVLAAALTYPLIVISGGGPRFPSLAECVHAAKADGNLEAVFGRYPSETAATTALEHVIKLGFTGSLVEPDGCGRAKVVVRGVPTLAVGRDLIAEARSAGLEPTLETAP